MIEGAAKREPQITVAFAHLDKNVSILYDIINKLEENLAGVLRDEPNIAGKIEEEKPETKVAVANAIHNLSDRVGTIIFKVESMLKRLEL